MAKKSKAKDTPKKSEINTGKFVRIIIEIDEHDMAQYQKQIKEYLDCSSSYLYGVFGDKVEVSYNTGHIYIRGNDIFGTNKTNIMNVMQQLLIAIKTSRAVHIDIVCQGLLNFDHWHYWQSGDKYRLSYTNNPRENIIDTGEFEENLDPTDLDTLVVSASDVTLKACCSNCNGKHEDEEYCDAECIPLIDPDHQRCKSWWPSDKCLEETILKQVYDNTEE